MEQGKGIVGVDAFNYVKGCSMLTEKILPTRKANSVTVQCKFHIRLKDLATNLNLSEQNAKLLVCSERKIREFLLLNFEIVDILKWADEILEFKIVDIGKEIHEKKML